MSDEIDVNCFLCPAATESVEEAIEAGWAPSFLMPNGEECYAALCPACQAKHAELLDEDFILKPEALAFRRGV
jgi:homoaconitase/3-isopropylmalate dehydratase large subunit